MVLETHVRSMAVEMRRMRARDAGPAPSRGPTMAMSSPGREKKPRFGSAPTSTNGGLAVKTERLKIDVCEWDATQMQRE
jgi:hypothetical protein